MLKKTIEEGVYFAFRRAQAEALNQDRSHELHVTDTVSPCLRKTIYGKINPISIDTESMSHLYMGQAVHGLSHYHQIYMRFHLHMIGWKTSL